MIPEQLYLSVGIPTIAVLIHLLANVRWYGDTSARLLAVEARMGRLEEKLAESQVKAAERHYELIQRLDQLASRVERLEVQPR